MSPAALLKTALVLLLVSTTASVAEAGIPIIYGHGEEIAHVADLGPEAQAKAKSELGGEVAIGWLYQRFHIFWMDLWTWGGEHVLYAGNECWSMEEADWLDVVGADYQAQLATPWTYYAPPGLLIVACFLILSVATKLCTSDDKKVKALRHDPLYSQAVGLYSQKAAASRDAVADGTATGISQSGLLEAVKFLHTQGVPAADAERNMRSLLKSGLDLPQYAIAPVR